MKLKIINCNIWIGGILFDELLSFLKEEDADILLLQEVYAGDDSFETKQHRSLYELQTTLGYSHTSFAPAFFEKVDGKELQQGNAILSKYPLEEMKTIFFDVHYQERDPDDHTKYHITPRNMQHCIARVKGRALHLFNIQGIWGEHGGDTPRRLHMADKILASLPSVSKHIVLAGDFNVDERTQTIAKIEEKLDNVFKDQLKTSFNIQNKDIIANPGYASSVVDMVFVSASVKILHSRVSRSNVSDHLPLVIEVEI